MGQQVSFYTATSTQLATAVSNSELVLGGIYFITDTQAVCLATSINSYKDYTSKVRLVDDFPETPEQGVLYISNDDKTTKVYSGTGWITLNSGTTYDTTISSSSGNSTAPTSYAVYNFVTGLTTNTGGTAAESGKIPLLNASGKLNSDVLPALALSEYIGEVSSLADLTTLTTAEKGDWAKVSGSATASENGSYILNGTYSTQGNWVRLADALDEISIDATITSSSSNPVASSAIYTALSSKLNAPSSNGTSGQLLQTNGDGTTSWITSTASTLEWGELS